MRRVKFYALSTCGWCRRTKKLLDENGVQYDLVYVDLLQGEEQKKTLDEVARWNPRLSFPTLVLDDKEVIIGYDEARIKEALGL